MIEIGVFECLCERKARHIDLGCDADRIRTRINGEKCCGRYKQTDVHLMTAHQARELIEMLDLLCDEEEDRETAP